MNKIILDSENILIEKDYFYYLYIKNNINFKISVLNGVKSKLIIINENNSSNLLFNLEENSELVVNNINLNSNNKIVIDLLDNSSIIYNQSVVAKIDSVNNIIINHLGNNTNSIINNNGINLSENKLFFVIDGKVNKKLMDVKCNQSSQIINFKNGNSKIIPNLIIDSNDISASHSAHIGNISDELKFYVKSRGISEEALYEMFYKAILLGKMDFTIIDDSFIKIINEWW